MMEKGYLKSILRSEQSVFTFKELLLTWNVDPGIARRRISYYLKTGGLYAIRRGIYAKDQNYDRLELGTRIYTPSYISFETVLGSAGITFQYYTQIFVASYQSDEIIADGQPFVFRKLKDSILFNSSGIENRQHYAIATPERALLDVIYLHKEYHFDNLSQINWDVIHQISPIYESRKVFDRINKYYRLTRE
jgi:predicted transcriptional regulator of viral defense system